MQAAAADSLARLVEDENTRWLRLVWEWALLNTAGDLDCRCCLEAADVGN